MTFTHRFVPSAQVGARTLVLFHGTGGDETSLLDLGTALDPKAALLGIRGNSTEEGLNRFFRRFTEGLFDEADIAAQAYDLSEFLGAATLKYNLETERIGVGYSNGANMAAALLLLHSGALDGAILLRGMLPLRPQSPPELFSKRVLMANGDADPLAPIQSANELAALLQEYGASVTQNVVHAGHSITRTEVVAAAAWLAAE